MAKLIRAGKVPCDLQESDDGEGGTCYPFTVNMERRRVSRNENCRSISETGPKGKVIDFVLRGKGWCITFSSDVLSENCNQKCYSITIAVK